MRQLSDRQTRPRYPVQAIRRAPIKRLVVILGAMTLGSSAIAAGIDSRAYSCAELHGLITAGGFVFINNPNFGDFVVANASYCGGGRDVPLQRRSVPTTDNPECLVNYCGASPDNMSGGTGGGM